MDIFPVSELFLIQKTQTGEKTNETESSCRNDNMLPIGSRVLTRKTNFYANWPLRRLRKYRFRNISSPPRTEQVSTNRNAYLVWPIRVMI